MGLGADRHRGKHCSDGVTLPAFALQQHCRLYTTEESSVGAFGFDL